jgi:phage protein D
MPNAFRLLFDGQPATDDFYTQLSSVEVEESLDMPGAFELELPVSRSTSGDLSFINDSQFQPYVNVAVVALADKEPAECIFDGFVLASKLHLESGAINSKLRVWGQDASWLMNLEEKVKEWTDVTDGTVANSIFGDYGFTPAPENTDGDSPSHTEDVNTLMQRATDIQFLRMLAKRAGKFVRVACGSEPGTRTGYFVRPTLDGDPVVTLQATDKDQCNVDGIDLEWDVTRPSEVAARQALISSDDEDGASGDATESGLSPLSDRDLPTFAGRPNKALLTSAASEAGDLSLRAKALLTDAGWFARCEGQTDLARLKKVLRAGTVVAIAGAGSVHSGKYLVWSVRHTINQDAHIMKFSLVRNAVGSPATGGGGGGLF